MDCIPSFTLIALKCGHNSPTLKTQPSPSSRDPPLGEGEFDLKNQNSQQNGIFIPSLSLIPLNMWPQSTYPQNTAPPLLWELGGFQIKTKNHHPNGVFIPSFSLIALKMWPQLTYPQNIVPPLLQGPPPGEGGI